MDPRITNIPVATVGAAEFNRSQTINSFQADDSEKTWVRERDNSQEGVEDKVMTTRYDSRDRVESGPNYRNGEEFDDSNCQVEPSRKRSRSFDLKLNRSTFKKRRATGHDEGVDPDELNRKIRGECYRCGGKNHIVLVCTSTERDAYKNLNLPQCNACCGRGHVAENCPTVVNANPCYNCKQQGHFARNCPYVGEKDNKRNPYVDQSTPPYQEIQNNLNESISAQLSLYGYSSPQQLYAALNMAAASGAFSNYGYQQGSLSSIPNYEYRSHFFEQSEKEEYRIEKYKPTVPNSAANQMGKCFRCGKDGHWTRDCPLRPSDADPNGCYKCGRLGHRSRDCTACYRCGQEGHRAAECTTRQGKEVS